MVERADDGQIREQVPTLHRSIGELRPIGKTTRASSKGQTTCALVTTYPLSVSAPLPVDVGVSMYAIAGATLSKISVAVSAGRRSGAGVGIGVGWGAGAGVGVGMGVGVEVGVGMGVGVGVGVGMGVGVGVEVGSEVGVDASERDGALASVGGAAPLHPAKRSSPATVVLSVRQNRKATLPRRLAARRESVAYSLAGGAPSLWIPALRGNDGAARKRNAPRAQPDASPIRGPSPPAA